MSTGYQIDEPEGLYFVTLQVVDWVDVFTRQAYKDILIDSLAYCKKTKGYSSANNYAGVPSVLDVEILPLVWKTI